MRNRGLSKTSCTGPKKKTQKKLIVPKVIASDNGLKCNSLVMFKNDQGDGFFRDPLDPAKVVFLMENHAVFFSMDVRMDMRVLA